MNQDLDNEKLWYGKNPWKRPDHVLMKWPFVHPARQERAWRVARENVRKALFDYFSGRGGAPVPRALVAPCGSTADHDILHGIAEEFHGIDVSPAAVEECGKAYPEIRLKEGNILESGYGDGSFDLVASFLFFHHLHKVGFDPFLLEFHRILRPGGVLAVFEPSALSPVSFFTGLGKKAFGNVSGLVPDEAPIVPSRLDASIGKAGFRLAKFAGVSFSHNRMPVPMQRLVETVSGPFAGLSPFNRTAWLCLWICEKEGADSPVRRGLEGDETLREHPGRCGGRRR